MICPGPNYTYASYLFVTDANGRQNVKRFRNSRIDYDISNATLEEPVASNYYPINSWISMKGGLIFEITISRKNLFIFIYIFHRLYKQQMVEYSHRS